MMWKLLTCFTLFGLVFPGFAAEPPGSAVTPPVFVTVDDDKFRLGDRPYCFVGTNLWYGAYLAADASFGNRDRLRYELDLMLEHGVTNVRVLAGSEASPLRDSLRVSFRDRSDDYNETLLQGLDVLLVELAARNMKAVIYLNNFWEWSGGMATYLYWVNGGEIVDPADPDQPWPAFADFTAAFYTNDAARKLFNDYVSAVVTRVNSQTGIPYTEDPTIMAWQLANEPRPGYRNDLGFSRLGKYYDWIESTARLIKSLDPNHLVSIGSEGTIGCLQDVDCYLTSHRIDEIDYLTFHMWPKNWGWLDAGDMQGTFPKTLELATDYIDRHLAYASELGKPVVLEEFGLERNDGAYSLDSDTSFRDRFFSMVFDRVERSLSAGGGFAGTNFWTWGGAGRAQHPDYRWRPDDVSFTGDPPQEAQGLNSVFDSDRSTLEILRRHAENLAKLECAAADTASFEL